VLLFSFGQHWPFSQSSRTHTLGYDDHDYYQLFQCHSNCLIPQVPPFSILSIERFSLGTLILSVFCLSCIVLDISEPWRDGDQRGILPMF
jgi:hypothetical protein